MAVRLVSVKTKCRNCLKQQLFKLPVINDPNKVIIGMWHLAWCDHCNGPSYHIVMQIVSPYKDDRWRLG